MLQQDGAKSASSSRTSTGTVSKNKKKRKKATVEQRRKWTRTQLMKGKAQKMKKGNTTAVYGVEMMFICLQGAPTRRRRTSVTSITNCGSPILASPAWSELRTTTQPNATSSEVIRHQTCSKKTCAMLSGKSPQKEEQGKKMN